MVQQLAKRCSSSRTPVRLPLHPQYFFACCVRPCNVMSEGDVKPHAGPLRSLSQAHYMSPHKCAIRKMSSKRILARGTRCLAWLTLRKTGRQNSCFWKPPRFVPTAGHLQYRPASFLLRGPKGEERELNSCAGNNASSSCFVCCASSSSIQK